MADPGAEPWRWPEERWRSAVGRGRAGRSLRPKRWKGGARAALIVSFDCGFETTAITADGGSITGVARGHYGARAGIARILRILAQNRVQATFFLPAVAALLHPQEAKAIVAAGHEIGFAGWMNEARASLEPEAERELLAGALKSLGEASGTTPAGFRAGPGGLSDATLGILRSLGLTYDSSLAADDDPYEIAAADETPGLVELPLGPTDALLEDMLPGGGATTPEAVFDIFRREIEVAYQEGGLVHLALNPAVSGRRANAWVLEEILKVARALPGMWITTCADVAQYVRSR
jgi:peptidoglycan/xylan/chitin deacetylase (PgdA/CDA1 family)